MKIISGRLKGRILPTLKNATYRPSTGKLKEAIFSILGSLDKDLKGTSVLDLFAGTGGLAFESLSRFAANVTLVDIEAPYLAAAKEFATKIGEVDNCSFLRLDAANLAISRVQYDVVFIDPPYFKGLVPKTLKSIEEKFWVKDGAILVLEMASKENFIANESYVILKEKVYGNSKLVVLERKSKEQDFEANTKRTI